MEDEAELLLLLGSFVEIMLTLSFAISSLSAAYTKFKKVKRYKRKLGERKERDHIEQQYKRQKTRPPGPRIPRQLDANTDIYARTGLYAEEFFELADRLQPSIERSRNHGPTGTERRTRTVLSSEVRLLMILEWLRTYPSMKKLAHDYGVSKAFVSRDIHHLVPELYGQLHNIQWPGEVDKWVTASDFHQCVAAIDCTTHYRNRVHPRQAEYYRYDKKGFSITSQLICGLDGRIWRVDFGNGHNNDSGMVERTGLKALLQQNPNLHILGDSGYSALYFVTPRSGEGRDWENQQKSLRSVVETVFAIVKWYSLASSKFSGSPELQQVALACIYELVAKNLNDYPLRVSIQLQGRKVKAFS